MIEFIEEPAAWEECEAALDRRGTPLPLYHRGIWARARAGSGGQCSLVSIRGGDSTCRAAFAIESFPSRALPRHRLVSVLRLGAGAGGLDESAIDEGLAELSALGRTDRSVLRITVETFDLDAESRRRTADILRRHRFQKVPTSRTYERTLVLDLTPEEDALFAGLHKNARQGVRNVARFPVRVTTATSASLAPRLQALIDETLGRTAGERPLLDWSSIIEMSARAPQLSRITILERTDRSGPEAVIAFAWGCMHGQIAEYSQSGSTRAHDLKVSTSYALLWDLILWARAGGARCFDLGGVTTGSTHSDDPLGGISDFKRRFSQHEVEVGQQWELEPRPGRALAARLASRGAALVRTAINSRRSF